jgi:hypothetical protein
MKTEGLDRPESAQIARLGWSGLGDLGEPI